MRIKWPVEPCTYLRSRSSSQRLSRLSFSEGQAFQLVYRHDSTKKTSWVLRGGMSRWRGVSWGRWMGQSGHPCSPEDESCAVLDGRSRTEADSLWGSTDQKVPSVLSRATLGRQRSATRSAHLLPIPGTAVYATLKGALPHIKCACLLEMEAQSGEIASCSPVSVFSYLCCSGLNTKASKLT